MNEIQIDKKIYKFVTVTVLIFVILGTAFLSVYEWNNYSSQNTNNELNNQSSQNPSLTPSQLTKDQKNQFTDDLGPSQGVSDAKAFKVLDKLNSNKDVTKEQKEQILNSL